MEEDMTRDEMIDTINKELDTYRQGHKYVNEQEQFWINYDKYIAEQNTNRKEVA
jgi:hypothetical protein